MKEISNRPKKNRRKRINQTNPMNIEKCLFSTIKCCTPMSSNLYTFSNRFWTFHSFLEERMLFFCDEIKIIRGEILPDIYSSLAG